MKHEYVIKRVADMFNVVPMHGQNRRAAVIGKAVLYWWCDGNNLVTGLRWVKFPDPEHAVFHAAKFVDDNSAVNMRYTPVNWPLSESIRQIHAFNHPTRRYQGICGRRLYLSVEFMIPAWKPSVTFHAVANRTVPADPRIDCNGNPTFHVKSEHMKTTLFTSDPEGIAMAYGACGGAPPQPVYDWCCDHDQRFIDLLHFADPVA